MSIYRRNRGLTQTTGPHYAPAFRSCILVLLFALTLEANALSVSLAYTGDNAVTAAGVVLAGQGDELRFDIVADFRDHPTIGGGYGIDCATAPAATRWPDRAREMNHWHPPCFLTRVHPLARPSSSIPLPTIMATSNPQSLSLIMYGHLPQTAR